MTDYKVYKFSGKEMLIYGAEGLAIVAMIGFVFYRSFIAVVFLLPLIGFFLKYKKSQLKRKRKYELSMEFKEAIMGVNTSLTAGYSIENAFIEAGKDMARLYGEDGLITKEFVYLTRALRANETLESILSDMAGRSGVEDIRDFADVFAAAKRSGGDLNRIIRRAADTISEKMDVKREIETITSSKSFENRIMEIVPFAIICYISLTSPDFIEGLYHNATGVIIMTVCLLIYAAGFVMAEKIVNIQI